MSNVYSSKDYIIKLDGNVIDADEVHEKVYPAPLYKPTDADIILLVDNPDNFYLDVGNHQVTLVPRDTSKTTITYNVILRRSRDISPYSITFMRNGSAEETPTQV